MKQLSLLTATILMFAASMHASAPYSQTLLRLAESGDVKAQYEIGQAYVEGNGINKNLEEGRKWMEKSALNGNVDAQSYLGDIYYFGMNDYQKACEWWQKASDGGDNYATFNLSCMYQEGTGVKRDMAKSNSLLLKGAKRGSVECMFNLANRYSRGDGVNADIKEAIRWYEKAAEKGHAGAFYNLGLIYYTGEGVDKNYPKALSYLEKAADKDYIYALLMLGEVYYDASPLVGGKPDYNKAFSFTSRFIDQSSDDEVDNEMLSSAYNILSKCYRNGQGVKADKSKADEYMRKSISYGDSQRAGRSRSLDF